VRFLLDTHVLLWWRDDSPRLSPRARRDIADAANEILVRIVSLWEITIKRNLEKLRFADDLEQVLEEETFCLMPFTFEHLRRLKTLPQLHRDPFDRMFGRSGVGGGNAADHKRHRARELRRSGHLVSSAARSCAVAARSRPPSAARTTR
jgi:PIN domain nuclease of toxin-antitoxin system